MFQMIPWTYSYIFNIEIALYVENEYQSITVHNLFYILLIPFINFAEDFYIFFNKSKSAFFNINISPETFTTNLNTHIWDLSNNVG